MSALCECGCGQPAPIATRTDRKWGAVKGQPRRFLHGHHLKNNAPRYRQEDRGFTSPCWVWQRKLNHAGYGRLDSRTLAHRAFYVEAKGPIPEGLALDHLCRVRACVNPDHLEPVTDAENNRRGENTRLTFEQAREVHRSTESNAALALRFGVHRDTIRAIRRGQSWRDAA